MKGYEKLFKRMSVELLQIKQKRAVVPTVGKALRVLFGTVWEDVKIIRRKMKEVEKNQRVLAHVARQSESILNVTKLEVAKTRGNRIRLMDNMQALREEVVNVSKTMTTEFQEFTNFIQQYFQLMRIIYKVRQTSQSLMTLFRAQLDVLRLGYLAPSIVAPDNLK